MWKTFIKQIVHYTLPDNRKYSLWTQLPSIIQSVKRKKYQINWKKLHEVLLHGTESEESLIPENIHV